MLPVSPRTFCCTVLMGGPVKDATKKAYCDKEMTETAAKKEYKADTIDKLSTKIDKMNAASAKLKEEVPE